MLLPWAGRAGRRPVLRVIKIAAIRAGPDQLTDGQDHQAVVAVGDVQRRPLAESGLDGANPPVL